MNVQPQRQNRNRPYRSTALIWTNTSLPPPSGATYAPFRAGLKHRLHSVTKSVTSTLVGMALGDGLLDSTDRRVVDFFAGRTIANLVAFVMSGLRPVFPQHRTSLVGTSQLGQEWTCKLHRAMGPCEQQGSSRGSYRKSGSIPFAAAGRAR